MPFAPGGRKYAGILAGAGVLASLITPFLGVGLLALSGGILWFYRDPDRSIPSDGIVAPADGVVRQISEETGRIRVSIFMNVTDVHVNRAATDGKVMAITRETGGHRPAFLPGAEKNARVTIELDTHEVTLITGSIARRITTYVSGNDTVRRGDRIGHIAFGSRVDVMLPTFVTERDLLVAKGERVRAGESVIAASM